MVKVALVEDEQDCKETVLGYLRDMQAQEGTAFHVTHYADGLTFLSEYREQFDVVLMDIGLPDLNGMAVAEKLRKVDMGVVLIFITSMAQFAVRGYAVRALDYIVKPFSKDEFALKIRRAVREVMKKKTDTFVVNTENGKMFLSTSDIAYIEVQGHQLIYYTAGGDRIESKGRGSLTKAEENFSKDGFIRCSHAYLLNPRYIQKISKESIWIMDTEIRISRVMKNEFMEKLAAFLETGGLSND